MKKPSIKTPGQLRYRMAQLIDEVQTSQIEDNKAKLIIGAAAVITKSYGTEYIVNNALGITKQIDFIEEIPKTNLIEDKK